MTTWEEIRDEVAGMLADGQPLEDVISKLDEMKKPKPMTNEEYLRSLNTEQLAKVLLSFCQYPCEICKIECDDGNACTYNKALNTIAEWLKQPHTTKE